MVQTKNRRRSSLVMGLLLALLLGVAAAFFVLAMPIRMLETVTTVTRLAKLMVQAEPPISPNDRTLLAVLAGIVTAGIGWVLVDWLLFGRAGMSTLIRTREDDYEDEDEDAYRPTDPLDLVTPMAARGHDWSQDAAGDTRRPLSARTDIGEPEPFAPPPLFGQPPAAPFGAPQPAIPTPHQPFPAGGILPGAGVPAPPLQPHVPPPTQPAAPADPFAAAPMPAWAVPAAVALPAIDANFDLPDRPAGFQTQAAAEPPAQPAPLSTPAGMPSWLPAPGSRPDAVPPLFGTMPTAEPTIPAPFAPEAPIAAPVAPADPFAMTPPAPIVPPLQPAAPEPPQLILSQPAPPLPMPPVEAEQPRREPPSFVAPVPPVTAAPPFAPVAAQAPPEPPLAPSQQPFFTSGSSIPPGAPVAPIAPAPIPQAAAPAPVPAPAPAAVAPAAPRAAVDPLMDRARLHDLLSQLEAKVQNRRAAAAPQAPVAAPPPIAQAAPPMAPVVPLAPAPIAAAPPLLHQRAELPSGFAAPPPQMPPPFPTPQPAAPVYETPPAQPSPAFSLGLQAEAPLSASAPVAAPVPLPRIDEARKEQLLDQPLHVTLDLLRSMVKR